MASPERGPMAWDLLYGVSVSEDRCAVIDLMNSEGAYRLFHYNYSYWRTVAAAPVIGNQRVSGLDVAPNSFILVGLGLSSPLADHQRRSFEQGCS